MTSEFLYNDPIFQSVVDKIVEAMEKRKFSLNEIIEAATIAAVRYKMTHQDDELEIF